MYRYSTTLIRRPCCKKSCTVVELKRQLGTETVFKLILCETTKVYAMRIGEVLLYVMNTSYLRSYVSFIALWKLLIRASNIIFGANSRYLFQPPFSFNFFFHYGRLINRSCRLHVTYLKMQRGGIMTSAVRFAGPISEHLCAVITSN